MNQKTKSTLLAGLAAAALLALVAAPSSAGRGHFEKRAAKKGWDYPKLTRYTFLQDAKAFGRLTLGANVELAMWRLEDEFLPVIFILASEKDPPVSIEPERFQLELPDGTTLDAVPYGGLMAKGYKSEMVHDWSRLETINPTHGWFTTGYRYVHTQLYPDPSGLRRGGLVQEGIEVGGDQYAVDLVYFPNPGGLAGRELRLVYEAAEPKSAKRRAKDVVRRISVPFVVPDPYADDDKKPQSRPAREGR